MSRQRSLEQERAKKAWDAIKPIKGKGFESKFKSLATGSPADIQTNGLGQTLAFWKAKKGDEHKALYEALAAWLQEETLSIVPRGKDLLEWVLEASTEGYRRATTEAMAFLTWLKRFAEAELGD